MKKKESLIFIGLTTVISTIIGSFMYNLNEYLIFKEIFFRTCVGVSLTLLVGLLYMFIKGKKIVWVDRDDKEIQNNVCDEIIN